MLFRSGIVLVEMHHLEILGQLILKLGGDPEYICHQGRSKKSWTPEHISYSKTFNKIILDDIEGEKEAIRNYEGNIKIIEEEAITVILKRIVLDEQYHVEILKSMLK